MLLGFIYDFIDFLDKNHLNDSFAIRIATFTMPYLKLLLCSPRVVKMVALEIENYLIKEKKEKKKRVQYSSPINF